ncbi:MAG: hypothetical protein M1814_006056 [Vezdaea aestivalis]|nr:MAG: hypothetical protein M1814_006056 [Vezdaea aestivalis]
MTASAVAPNESPASGHPHLIEGSHGGHHARRGFKKHHEAEPTELFYDLFFIANLSTFTVVHPVNDTESLSSYIGFFCLLWFTWLQVTLYDVRFSNDSILERLLKGFQLAGMIGFSALNLKFLPSNLVTNYEVLTAFSCILMGTRLALCLQYLVTVHAVRDLPAEERRHTRTPLFIHATSCFVAAICYAAMAGAFSRKNDGHAYVAWFVIAVLETGQLSTCDILKHAPNLNVASTVVTAAFFNVANFKHTPLTERMRLLTLIIIGEGIIILMKTIQNVVKNGSGYSAGAVGSIFSVGVTYYLLYMLYFDKIRKSFFGAVHEELWALLHFPFHICLILFVEGINEMATAYKYFEEFTRYSDLMSINFLNLTTYEPFTESNMNLATVADDWLDVVLTQFPEAISKGSDIDKLSLAQFALKNNSVTTTFNEYVNNTDFNTVFAYGLNSIFLSFGLKESENVKTLTLVDRIGQDQQIFQLIFGYLYTCAGLVLIFIALLSYINSSFKHRLSGREWINLGTHVIVGLGLSLIATFLTTADTFSTKGAKTLEQLLVSSKPGRNTIFYDFVQSAWVLPLIAISFAIVVAGELIFLFVNGSKGKKSAFVHQVEDEMKHTPNGQHSGR